MAENLVNGTIARAELGKPGPPIGMTRYSALKRAAGMSGRRYVMVSALRDYLLAHPDFNESQVYPHSHNVKRFPCPKCGKLVSERAGRLRWHICTDNIRPDDVKPANPGHIYILINASMPGLLKVGRTENDPESRAQALSGTTGVASPFIVAYSVPVGDQIEFERRVHKKMEKFRHSRDREFFTCPLRELIEVIESFRRTADVLEDAK